MRGLFSRLMLMSGGVLCLCVLAASKPARAIQGLGISPTSQELRLQPGQIYSGALTIINDGGEDVTYTLVPSDYKIKDSESYLPDFSFSGDPASISPVTWFAIKTAPTLIRAHQEATVPYKIIVPNNAVTGGHYAVIFAQSEPKSGSGSAVINKVVRVGSIFYLATGGDLTEKARVLPPQIGWFQVDEPFDAKLKIQNQGNVHFLATGTARATPLFGKLGPIVQFKGEVLPQTTRTFSLEIPARQPIGLYKVTFVPNYFGHDQPPIERWVLLVPKLTIFILLSTLIVIGGYFLLKLVNYLFHRNDESDGS